MNTKILSYVLKNLDDAFKLERWNEIRINLNKDNDFKSLPWTPKRLEKFEQDLRDTFDVEPIIQGSVSELVEDLDVKYATRFWGGGVWQPKTDIYQYTGWGIVDEINNMTFHELDSIITRIGNNCRIILCGDFRQSDLTKEQERNGLKDFIKVVDKLNDFTYIEFIQQDIVRSKLVKEYIIAREKLGLQP